MSRTLDALLASPRRRVRYVYLRDAWPEMPSDMDPTEAIMAAPDAAVIDALTREVETYGEVIQEERRRADRAEGELAELRRALRLIGEALSTTPALSADLNLDCAPC